jgi:arylsulfatase A-like enzyme
MIRLPDGPAGRSSILAQPQDITTTLLNLAGVQPPAALAGHDLLAQAGNGTPAREVALAASAASGWARGPHPFTVFDGEQYLHVGVRPEDSVLTRLGSVENTAGGDPETVQRLHAAGLAELERRAAAPELMAWLRSRGEKPFPANRALYAGCPEPLAYERYFGRIYYGT